MRQGLGNIHIVSLDKLKDTFYYNSRDNHINAAITFYLYIIRHVLRLIDSPI